MEKPFYDGLISSYRVFLEWYSGNRSRFWMLCIFEHFFEESEMLPLKFKLKYTLTQPCLMACLLFSAYPLCAQIADRPIRVAARICPPFIMNDTGQYLGISIYQFIILILLLVLSRGPVGIEKS
jgi:hypothetical protein